MKTELERHREALKVAILEMRGMGLDYSHFTNSVEEKINAILHPAPELETVEATLWAELAPNGEIIATWPLETTAVHARGELVKLTGSYTRPKEAMVERSASVEARVNHSGDPYPPHSSPLHVPFAEHEETYNKVGTLTFTWHEPKGEQQ